MKKFDPKLSVCGFRLFDKVDIIDSVLFNHALFFGTIFFVVNKGVKV